MKKLTLILFLILLPILAHAGGMMLGIVGGGTPGGGGYATPALVGTATASADGANADRILGAGNLLVILAASEDAVAAPVSCTVGGNATQACTGAFYTEVETRIFYYPNTTAGSKTIAVTYAASAAYKCWVALEFSGIATSTPLDQQAAAAGTAQGTNPTTSTVTTTLANEVWVAIVRNYEGSATSPNTSPSTWNESYDGSSTNGTEVQYLIVSSIGTNIVGAGTIPSGWWAVSLATFKAAAL